MEYYNQGSKTTENSKIPLDNLYYHFKNLSQVTTNSNSDSSNSYHPGSKNTLKDHRNTRFEGYFTLPHHFISFYVDFYQKGKFGPPTFFKKKISKITRLLLGVFRVATIWGSNVIKGSLQVKNLIFLNMFKNFYLQKKI